MLEEKILELYDMLKEHNEMNKQIMDINKKYSEMMSQAIEHNEKMKLKKHELGNTIVNLGSNIYIEIEGKPYNIFYNQKRQEAMIVPVLSVKEAELKLAINKLQK